MTLNEFQTSFQKYVCRTINQSYMDSKKTQNQSKNVTNRMSTEYARINELARKTA